MIVFFFFWWLKCENTSLNDQRRQIFLPREEDEYDYRGKEISEEKQICEGYGPQLYTNGI